MIIFRKIFHDASKELEGAMIRDAIILYAKHPTAFRSDLIPYPGEKGAGTVKVRATAWHHYLYIDLWLFRLNFEWDRPKVIIDVSRLYKPLDYRIGIEQEKDGR